MFPEQQISTLEWVLQGHVTLKTGVMMLKTYYMSIKYLFEKYEKSYQSQTWTIVYVYH